MRETCARVLAAALMTGAIAAVVAMSALLNTPRDDGYALTTPPSSLQRSVRVPALAAPPRRVRVERLVTGPSIRVVPRSAVPEPRSIPNPPSAGRSAPKSPAPKPPEPETRELAATTPTPEVQPPAQASSTQAPTSAEPIKGKSKGRAKGKSKAKRRNEAQQPSAQPSAPSAPVAAAPPASDSESQDQSEAEKDRGHGNGNGQGHGHDKGDRKG